MFSSFGLGRLGLLQRWGGGEAAFSPLSLSPIAWYDLSDLTTLFQDSGATTPVTADGDVIGYIGDKSGNAQHVTQTTTAQKPLYKTLGGLHWGRGDGTDDDLTDGLLAEYSQPYTMAIAFKYEVLTANANIFDIGSGGAGNRALIGTNGTNQFIMYAGSASVIAASDTNSHTLICEFEGATSTANLDGSSTSESAGTAILTLGQTIALYSTVGTSAFCNARIYQALFFNKRLTAQEESDLTTWLAGKAGL